MSERPSAAYQECIDAQRAAADPARSAFVAANAGAGKTRVLTDRVARLLLSGAEPRRILCITFTKAAAAEMASRLFALLGRWALADDATLSAALDELEGVARPRDAGALAGARRLFAKALETPGGLKIQTIHSFCERLLKRFPLEAGVAPGFGVIDENAAPGLARAAIDAAAAGAARDEGLGRAFERLALRFNPESARDGGQATLRSLIADALAARGKLDEALAAAGGWDRLRAAVAAMLAVAPDESAAAIRAGAIAAITDETGLRRAEAALNASGGNPEKQCGKPIGRFFAASSPDERWEALRSLFIKSDGLPRENFGTKKTAAIDAGVEALLTGWRDAFVDASIRAKAADSAADTAALLTILERAFQAYERLKLDRGALDYDDLVARAARLFAETDLDWVRYKIDQGLDHILLDEAQDTSPAQWKVVEGPLGEFFAGKGARDEPRTFFAVGDQKQSIYSFQGADAGLFKEKREDLGKRIAAAAPFANVSLKLSFRSTAPVLGFVDALFADDSVLHGVSDERPLRHELNRIGEAGLVELWPLAPRAKKGEVRAWDAPLDYLPADNPARRLALEVAERIKAWLAARETLASKGRPIRPGDVMILVQSRAALFHEMIRALTEKGVPVAGADKLKLLEDAAVEDLLSYARAALLEEDNLSLAEILKSPLFEFDDDDLFALAHDRQGSLWRALAERAEERPAWRRARAEIAIARAVGLKEGAFAFFSHLLETGEPSGRKRLYARLGEASAEPVAELLRQALDYELKNPRSLQGFLVWAERNAGEIKRDMEETSEAVRVMTVHGAKGLQSEIVILLDAHKPPNLSKLGPLFFAESAMAPLPLFSLNKESDPAAASLARDDARRLAYEEYRRLLYVAATRAKDRLYVCGVERGSGDPHARDAEEKTWHALAEDAFARLGASASEAGQTSWGGRIRRLDCAQTAIIGDRKVPATTAVAPPPLWLAAPAAVEPPTLRLSPSRLTDDAEAKEEPASFSPSRPSDAFLRGRVLHRLLELLPEIPSAERHAAADRLLSRLAPDVAAEERGRWRAEALAVIADPAFAPVFGPASRAEVAIAGRPKGAKPGFVVAGQIDRLAVDGARVLIVDYKTNRPPPQRLEETPEAYVAQLAAYRALLHEIYPNKSIEAALLWTFEARLAVVPGPMLDHAFARFLA